MKTVRFTGKFRDLKPLGYTFWKAFARNYRVYTKRPDGGKWGQAINIWQHCGGYLEIDDYQDLSYLVVELIEQKRIETFRNRNGCFWTKLNIEKCLVEDYRPALIDDLQWRSTHLLESTIREIQFLLNNNMIKIVEEKTK